jgi:predicted ATPase
MRSRIAPIFKVLGAMRVYSIEPSKLREMQDPDSGVTLKPDGGNAASVLQELTRGDGAAATQDDINRILESIVPATKSVTPKKHGNKLSMSFAQEWGDRKKLTFDAFNMSDGTLRSLGLTMTKKQRLELTWTCLRRAFGRQVGKENRPRLEPRIFSSSPREARAGGGPRRGVCPP